MVAYSKRYNPMDALTLFCEDLTQTASGVIQMSSVARILDNMGGGRQDVEFVVQIGSIDTVSADEKYDFLLQGSTVEAFTAGTIINCAQMTFGATAVMPGAAKTSVPGIYSVRTSNFLGDAYRFWRLNLLIAGTTPSITFSSWLSMPNRA